MTPSRYTRQLTQADSPGNPNVSAYRVYSCPSESIRGSLPACPIQAQGRLFGTTLAIAPEHAAAPPWPRSGRSLPLAGLFRSFQTRCPRGGLVGGRW